MIRLEPMRAAVFASMLVACAPAPRAEPRANPVPPPAATTSVTTPSCPDGRASLFLRDDANHCVWTCDPEADEPCPEDFACVGVGRTPNDTLARYCETLKGEGIADGVTYPPEWRPKSGK